MSLMFNGIGVSRGIAIGAKRDVPAEVRRFKRALKNARAQLLNARDNIPKDAPSDVSAFIETHILMLDDVLLSQRPIEIIKASRINAEAAMQQQREELARVFGSMEDSYLATRMDDVNHVIDSVLRALDDEEAEQQIGDAQWKGRIVIADDLTPADTVAMQHHGVAGFVTETGGQLSHTAILARSLGIPAIVGVHDVRSYIKNGETLTVNGASGLVLAEATDGMIADFRRQQKEARQRERELRTLIDTEAVTLDGIALTLSANIEIDEDLKALRRVNADGVGLYRTEFLYMNREEPPNEQDHFKEYTRVMRALKGAPLTIRTADLGADKMPGNVVDTTARDSSRIRTWPDQNPLADDH